MLLAQLTYFDLGSLFMKIPARLCLNMIVKNEMANLECCLGSVADYIACWVIGDTGSTDGTQDFIKAYFAERKIPGELHSFPFINFEQARNAALERAYASALEYDYLLLADADMELVVEDRDFRNSLEAGCYDLLQRSGISYWNPRIVRRDAGARYHGVTHEYLEVPGGPNKMLNGVWYKDHASGANRVNKFERDIKLLSEALRHEPDNVRYWFYLAQSYRDAGRTAEAEKAYAKRAEMGGWDEEAWYARLQAARCLRRLGDEGGFLRQALAAFNQRPQRAEPLYDLARFYRENGMNDASAMFSERGLEIGRPERDILFLEDFVYTAGLQEEYSIAANYACDADRRDRGFAACNWLALNREIPVGTRELAWSNLLYYLKPAKEMMPSFAACPIKFSEPDGYWPSNPCVTQFNGQIALLQRTVNYTLTEDELRYETPDGAPIHTRNFLLRLYDDLTVRSVAEILPPADMPAPSFELVLGLEDMRLFAWRDELWSVACVRELTAEGWCEQVLARIDDSGAGACRLADWRVLRPEGPKRHEKNWMPQVAADRLQFIYLCDPTRVLDEHARTLCETTPPIAASLFRGGSPLIGFDGGWLALIHEVQWRPTENRRIYQHRFVWFDESNSLRRVSRPFWFHHKGVEFAAGLCWHLDGERLVLSFSVIDREAWIATVDAGDVRAVLDDAEGLPSGRSATGRRFAQNGAGRDRAGVAAIAPPANEATTSAEKQTQESATEPDPLDHQGNSDRGYEAAADVLTSGRSKRNKHLSGGASESTEEVFLDLAPFLRSVEQPRERREASRAFDARVAPLLRHAAGAALPQIHCFYEVLSEKADHRALIAATASMRAAGHPVRVWTYSPHRLDFLRAHGVEVIPADDVMPRGLFERIVSGSEIRQFSDIFRYAVLYEHGGLWMDSDVILLRPFPFRGEYFFNLQWRSGGTGHFVCGNVIYSEPFSRHLRALYKTSLKHFFGASVWEFGAVGPKLLSNYIASEAGAALRDYVFGPTLFNPIDWTEIEVFEKPIEALADYLNDERLFGIHLWTARNAAVAGERAASLISLLSDPLQGFPSLTSLADRFNTDKNRHTGNRHCYARIYDRLLSNRRFSLRRLMEIGLSRWNQTETPSVSLWQTYFPFCHVTGLDVADFSALNGKRFSSIVCDQSNPDQVRAVAAQCEPGSFDIIIDDGSHASFDQQLTLREFFPLLADGGWYFIEDLDWQPPGESAGKITLTKQLLREIQEGGTAQSIDPLKVSELSEQMAEVLLFDSHYELQRANLLGGLAAIHKRGGSGLVR